MIEYFPDTRNTGGSVNRKKIICLFVLAASLAIFVILASLTVEGSAQEFNAAAYHKISGLISPVLTTAMIAVSNLGQWFVYTPIVVLLIAIPGSRFKAGIPAGIVLAVSAGMNVLLKLIFHIDRPNINRLVTETGYSFPSGHAMNCAAFIGICCYLFFRYSHKRPPKAAMLAGCVIFVLLMGFSRVYLGVHSLTDVFAGYAAGLAIVAAAVLAMEK